VAESLPDGRGSVRRGRRRLADELPARGRGDGGTAAGAGTWNDVTALRFAPDSLSTAAELGCELWTPERARAEGYKVGHLHVRLLNPLPVSSGDGADWLSAAMYGNDAWISGAGATLLHSTDSGRTWQPQDTSSTVDLNDLTFVSPTVGWAGNWEAVMRTTDGGQGWTTTDPCGTDTVQCLFALDATHAWAGCSPYNTKRAWTSLFRTTDGGASWATLSLPCPFDDVVFTSPTDGWGVADTDTVVDPGNGAMPFIVDVTSTIYRSSDAGTTWTPAFGSCSSSSRIFSINAARADAMFGESAGTAARAGILVPSMKNIPSTAAKTPLTRASRREQVLFRPPFSFFKFCWRHSLGVVPKRFLNMLLKRPRWR